ncbi:MAG: polyprenyl synthetase family protein [Desulfobacteraceae bacterium]|nr:polyprenyl synthetase family protein [Desulfobacteraceae bacterium]
MNDQGINNQDLKSKVMIKIQDDLKKIEDSLKKNLNAQLELAREIAGHLLFGKGKRLRPLLMINCAKMCGYHEKAESVKELIDFAIVFEYLHAATLLHDDVIDEADMRRGAKAAHKIWKTPKVILTGDFLLARSLSIATKTENLKIISTISHITEEMAQGEIDQLNQKGRLDLSEDQYFEIIRRKTAVLIEGACKCGALLANASKEKQDALFKYGYHLGIAFQMADDLLDYTSDAKTLGKNPGADLREGKLTLPLIKTLQRAQEKDKNKIEKIIQAQEFNQTEFDELVVMIHEYKGVDYTNEKALEHVKNAKACLELFESSEQKELLTMLADYSIQRKV